MKGLMRRVLALSALTTAVALVVGACGGADPTATPAPAPTATPVPVATATPEPEVGKVPNFPDAKYGGTIIRSKPKEGPGWDGHRERTENSHDIVDLTYDQIVMVDPHDQTGGMVPQLADSWDITSDGLTYTFNIHPGVKFHNGNDLTASDFVYTYDKVVLNPPEGIPSNQKGLMASVDTVSAPDDSTVVIKLSEPNAAFLTIIGFGRMHVFDEQFVEAEGRERMQNWPPMGTGPYMGEEGGWTKGVSLEVVRNPNYFVEGRPFVDGQQFYFIPDKGTRIAAFLTGQINFGVRPNVTEAEELQSKLGDKVYLQKTSTFTWWDMVLDTENPPFSDIRVREAVAWGIDKKGMIEAIQQGLGVLGGTIAPMSGWAIPEEELLTFAGYSGTRAENIAKAKALLTEAGYPDGFEADVWTRQHPSYIDPSTVMQAMLADIGITGEIVLNDSAVYFAEQKNHDAWDMQSAGHRFNGSDPNFMLPEYWLPGGARNTDGWTSPEVTAWIADQNAELDPVKRQEIVHKIERATIAGYGTPVQFFRVAQFAWYSNIKNYHVHAAYKANQQFRDIYMTSE